ncbi:dTDP-glucose 4,6-dehydratase [Parashewanella spongiae]|uniref:dTDP-glucose 4,6-dehydratase n=1 Tax=Parashewanella spongiae TaxID=342950 RepID=A0A3A6T2L9_9GAMM|nr:dTDP-glucose 4,6-dehydratase [Parashewanella spongiae]MCL1080267.1 dTDP-glucose 4,6-dehydratase [Parashewanella spongiae]RJY01834.1 dTDP-glucose 4,6-dehydratase [Parashewanella spongiae]
MKILITGGSGFIGSALIRYFIDNTQHHIINVDKITYASQIDGLCEYQAHEHYTFYQFDICNAEVLSQVLTQHTPDVIFHLAAESHVDRSISGAMPFIDTNIVGTFTLLESAKAYWSALPESKQADFRFIHVSTDEVYGDLPFDNEENKPSKFTESSPYLPNSPYSASKAASDHLVRAWHRTYGFPAMITHCSNNYGSHQHNEKLIPRVIACALAGKLLPVYGEGKQVRDWLHVDDHISALIAVMEKGLLGEVYNIGGDCEMSNLSLVKQLCRTLNELTQSQTDYQEKIEFVADRLGHDRRYAIENHKICSELGWSPKTDFTSGLYNTVKWYLDNPQWLKIDGDEIMKPLFSGSSLKKS